MHFVNLDSTRQRHDLISLQQARGFQDLKQEVQKLIIALSQGPIQYEDLKSFIQQQTDSARTHIRYAFQEHERRTSQDAHRSQILDSLWFNEVYSRQEKIKDAHKETFEWIFDKTGKAVRPWDNFVQWLEDGQNTYWINGKAGSGKSTLMSYLCQDSRTIGSLQAWSGDKDVLMPKFFFWSGGASMERSIEGLLRSLLWQLLQEFPDLDFDNVLVQSDICSGFRKRPLNRLGPIPAWTNRRLIALLQNLTQLILRSCYLCFFIDGLDEYEGDQEDLIDFVGTIVQNTNAKVCLSSRPYRVFDLAFGQSAKLRLQDLTYDDIRKFVNDKLEGAPQAISISHENPGRWKQFIDEIVNKAEGVFLWVALAVKDQAHGIKMEDSLDQLSERLEVLPNEVEGIYARMLKQIEKPYRRQASRFLHVALERNESGSLLDLALVSRVDLDHLLCTSDPISQRELISESQLIRNRMPTICAGLLEIHDKDQVEDHEQYFGSDNEGSALHLRGQVTQDEMSALGSYSKVDFIHRTAVDFVRNSQQGEAFLTANVPHDFDVRVCRVKIELIKLSLLGLPDEIYVPGNIMIRIARIEKMTGVANSKLCGLVDLTMSRIDRRHPHWRPDSHWCMRWGKLAEIHQCYKGFDAKSIVSSSIGHFSEMISPADTPCESAEAYHEWTGDVIKERGFLGSAALYGLSLYVQQELDCRRTSLEPNLADDILYCSVLCYVWRLAISALEGLKLTAEALSRGGNPNTAPNRKASSSTIWSRFLLKMHYELYRTRIMSTLSKAYAHAALAFVENGADVNAVRSIRVSAVEVVQDFVHASENVEVHDGSKFLRRKQHRYLFELLYSALALIELSLGGEPEIFRIREICHAKGGRSYRRCTRVQVFTGIVGRYEKGLLDEEYQLSEDESTSFLRLYEGEEFESRSGRSNRGLIELGHQIRQANLCASGEAPCR